MKKFFSSLLTFSGRSGRLKYFLANLLIPPAVAAVGVVILGAFGLLLRAFQSQILETAVHISLIPITLALLYILIVAPISFLVRRLHDLDLSGWWVFALWGWTLLLSLAFSSTIAETQNSWQENWKTAIFMILLFLPNLVLLFKRGTKGSNRFGHDPKELLEKNG